MYMMSTIFLICERNISNLFSYSHDSGSCESGMGKIKLNSINLAAVWHATLNHCATVCHSD